MLKNNFNFFLIILLESKKKRADFRELWVITNARVAQTTHFTIFFFFPTFYLNFVQRNNEASQFTNSIIIDSISLL